MIDVENCNRSNRKYPVTMRDKGWIYGVWYCGCEFSKRPLYGMYPRTFLKRALSLFPSAERILHCPSGTLTGPGITVDAVRDSVRIPQIVALAQALPFAAGTFDLILSDPPYTEADSKKYGVAKFPLGKAVSEFHRVLRPNGYLGLLHLWFPYLPKDKWALEGLIAVVTGFQRKVRMFSIARKLEQNQQNLDLK